MMEVPHPEPFESDVQCKILEARSKLWTPDLDKLLRKWKKQAGVREKGHVHQSRKFSRRHYIFGIPGILLSAMFATGNFSTFRDCDNDSEVICEIIQWLRFLFGIMAAISAGLSAFQTFMNYYASAEEHKKAGEGYNSLSRKIDSVISIPSVQRQDPKKTLQEIRSRYDKLIKKSPTIPKKYEDDGLNYKVKKWNRIPHPPKPDQIRGVLGTKTQQKSKTLEGLSSKFLPLERILKSESKSEGPQLQESDTESTVDDEGPSTMGEPSNNAEMGMPNKRSVISRTLTNIKKGLAEENDHDTSDDEVCIGFDLDEEPYYRAGLSHHDAMRYQLSRLEEV
jgi:hypothetical protein